MQGLARGGGGRHGRSILNTPHPGPRVDFHFDDGDPRQRMDIEAMLAARSSAGQHLYVCGPTGFMNHVLDAGAVSRLA